MALPVRGALTKLLFSVAEKQHVFTLVFLKSYIIKKGHKLCLERAFNYERDKTFFETNKIKYVTHSFVHVLQFIIYFWGFKVLKWPRKA